MTLIKINLNGVEAVTVAQNSAHSLHFVLSHATGLIELFNGIFRREGEYQFGVNGVLDDVSANACIKEDISSA